MVIKVTQLDLKEVLIFEYDKKMDKRGISYHLYSKKELEEVGIFTDFVEETVYCPIKKGTLMESIFRITLRHKQNCCFVLKDAGWILW